MKVNWIKTINGKELEGQLVIKIHLPKANSMKDNLQMTKLTDMEDKYGPTETTILAFGKTDNIREKVNLCINVKVWMLFSRESSKTGALLNHENTSDNNQN